MVPTTIGLLAIRIFCLASPHIRGDASTSRLSVRCELRSGRSRLRFAPPSRRRSLLLTAIGGLSTGPGRPTTRDLIGTYRKGVPFRPLEVYRFIPTGSPDRDEGVPFRPS